MQGLPLPTPRNGLVWNARKAASNPSKHDGVTFEQAATVFFDPFLRLVDGVDSMKAIAPRRGIAGDQPLLKSYLSEGLRRDEARFGSDERTRRMDALRRHGVPQSVLDEVAQEITAA
ncbi:MAG: hypothetical protein ACO3YN_18880 [Rubrivivax sp.]